ncbi:MAG: ATP synthase subunit I [Lachnospiraceae bacterium]|nr:ATP synthase subunit I [Lachnospiraceae bacterium]
MGIQDAVKKETAFVAVGCGIGTLFIISCFFLLHRFFPERVPFDFKVVLAAIVGSLVAIGNFFWMGLTVQKVSGIEDEARARNTMLLSYRYRLMAQMLWVVLALVLPVFNGLSGVLPLFLPSMLIKIRGILSAMKGR